MINQGDVFRIDLDEPKGSAPGYNHPHVVIQNNIYNRSNINTAVVCSITTNLRRAKAPGNVLLDKGEANLPRISVVNVSQIFTVDKRELVKRIGTLSQRRVSEILQGVNLVIKPGDVN